MKVATLAKAIDAATTSISRQQFDQDMKEKLNGKTVREACKLGLITDIGDDNGDFVFEHEEYDARYGAFNLDYIVPLSADLKEVVVGLKPAELTGYIMNCVFNLGVSTIPGEGLGKVFWNLGKSRTIRLKADAVNSLSAVTA